MDSALLRLVSQMPSLRNHLPPRSNRGYQHHIRQSRACTCRPDQKLPDFLDEYKQYAGLSVHWVVVGPSGQDVRPVAGGVLRNYDHCSGRGSPWIKTIANTFFLTNIAYHPHNFEFRCAL